MRTVLKIISYLALALTLIPAFLVFAGILSLETNKDLMFAGTIAWFLTAPFWMNLEKETQAIEDSKEIRDRI